MSAKSVSSRFALWAAVFALLLKAAVPMLAATAAHLRNVSVADVCPVYGVALPKPGSRDHQAGDLDHAGHAGHTDHSSHEVGAHAGDHCALTALGACAAPDIPTVFKLSVRVHDERPPPYAAVSIRDASAACSRFPPTSIRCAA